MSLPSCLTTSQPLLWLHVAGDGLIALACLLILLALLHIVRQRTGRPFAWVAWLFGAFMLAGALAHATAAFSACEPIDWLPGVLKALVAAVSLATAGVLYRLAPRLLAQLSGGQLREANAALQREIASRRQAEAELVRAKAEVEALLGKTTEQAQQASALLDRFFDVAPVGLALLDQQARFIRINPALARITRRAPEDYLGRQVEEVARMAPQTIAAIRSVARTGQSQLDLEVSRPDEDGTERHLLTQHFAIDLPGGGRLVGCVVQDISYQRAVERQREEALAAAEEANRAKDQFLAKVSHELRSPLQVALSCAEVLKRTPDLPATARKFVDRLAHAVSMQARMINDLLDLSRILSGKLHVVNEPIDPAMPLLRILDHWSTQAQARGVAIDASAVHPGQAMVDADPARLEQIYANLIDNAVRFSGEGGHVLVGGQSSRGHWRFFVRDFGAGMPREDLLRVFEPFAQGADQPKSGKGLGLGLAIVGSLVETFGGRVWAESAGPGTGATFVVELPRLVGDSHPPSDFGEAIGVPRLDGLRVLYVEDEEEVAAAMRDGLERLGAQVASASSYPQARELLQGLGLDAVVTDLNLGEDGSGHDVAEALRALPQHHLVPIVAVSAFGTRDDVAATREAGFADHLVKPVDVAAIAHALRRVVLR
ncbi:MAG: ATP-binding protein [Pseudomonadota bacterium]